MMRWLAPLALVPLFLLQTGCGRDWGTATGTCSVGGERMTKGIVTFHAVNGGADAYAQISSSGAYSMKTGSEDGLKSGDYVVTVVDQTIPESGDWVKILTPEKYSKPSTTDLKVTVKPGANQFNFDLKK